MTVFFYQEDNPNLNHTASISIDIKEMKQTPYVDFNNFTISLFHWSGSLHTYAYWYYQPSGFNPYFHFKIYDDGYVRLKFGDRELYDTNDLSGSEAKALIQELIDLGFYQLKRVYFSPGYSVTDYSYYQIAIDSAGTDTWRSCEESDYFIIRPKQYEKCLQAIKDRVDYLYFTPLRWKWEIALIIAGSTAGGLGVVVGSLYMIAFIRRRR